MELNNLILSISVPVFTTLVAIYVAFSKLSRELKNFKKQKIYELKLAHLSAQISEFYGPIYMITQANRKVYKETFDKKIWGKTWKNIIIPAEKKVLMILNTKIHLLERDYFQSNGLPDSFKSFIAHTSVTHSLLEDIDPDEVDFIGLIQDYGEDYRFFPKDFIEDIATGYEKKLNEYDELLKLEGLKN